MSNQVFFLRQQFQDFDEFCENAHNWDLDYRQHGITYNNFDVKMLDHICTALELPDFRKLPGAHEVFNCRPKYMTQLRKWLHNFALDLVNSRAMENNHARLQQLNGVRKALRQTDSGATRISEIAGVHGFWHMGQFAADYKHLFRELPSETLRNKLNSIGLPASGHL